MRIRIAVAVAALAAIVPALPRTASADMMTFDSLGQYYEAVTIYDSAAPNVNDQLVAAGQYLITYDGTQYNSYCVDINLDTGNGQVTEEPVTMLPNGRDIGYLYETYAPTVQDDLTAGALGVAIWEVQNETSGTFNALSGTFSIDRTDVGDLANTMLASLASIPADYEPSPSTIVLSSGTIQSQLIPEPATACLLILVWPALARRRRR